MAWRPDTVQGRFLAVGTPDQWHSSNPLPEGAVVTDLMEAALDQPDIADKLWGPFLTYVYVANLQDLPRLTRFRISLRSHFLGIPVAVSVADRTLGEAVKQAIRRSTYNKFRLL